MSPITSPDEDLVALSHRIGVHRGAAGGGCAPAAVPLSSKRKDVRLHEHPSPEFRTPASKLKANQQGSIRSNRPARVCGAPLTARPLPPLLPALFCALAAPGQRRHRDACVDGVPADPDRPTEGIMA
eukprot:366442-Chlamydomonas_euryale.AAC.22